MGIEERIPQEIIFQGEGLENNEVREAFESFLNSSGLTPEEIANVKENFRTNMTGAIRRRKKEGKVTTPDIAKSLMTWALAEAKNQVEQILVDKEQKKQRLCPELAGKTQTELDFNNYFENLKQLKGRSPDGKLKMMALVNFDLDDFKLVNDKYGHQAGDELIKAAGKALYDALRPTDIGAHYSGDEFGAILDLEIPPDTKPEEVDEVINNIISGIVDRIQKKITRPDGQEQQLSTGYAIVRHDSHGAYSDFAEKADGGQEGSKVFKILPGADGKPTRGPERVINFARKEQIEQEYPTVLVEKLKAIRSFTRSINELEAKGYIIPGINPRVAAEQLISSIMVEK